MIRLASHATSELISLASTCVRATAFSCFEGEPFRIELLGNEARLTTPPLGWPGDVALDFDRRGVQFVPRDVGGWLQLSLEIAHKVIELQVWCDPNPAKLSRRQLEHLIAAVRSQHIQLYRWHSASGASGGKGEKTVESAEEYVAKIVRSVERLEEAARIILRAPLKNLRMEERLVPLHSVAQPSARTFADWASMRHGAVPAPKEAVASLPELATTPSGAGEHYVPRVLPDRRAAHSFAVPENRLLKRALVDARQGLLWFLQQFDGNMPPGLNAPDAQDRAAARDRLENSALRVSTLLRRGFLPELSPWTELSYQSIALRRLPGYRQLRELLNDWRSEPLIDQSGPLLLAWQEPWWIFEIAVALTVHVELRAFLEPRGWKLTEAIPARDADSGMAFLIPWNHQMTLGVWTCAGASVRATYQARFDGYTGSAREPDVVIYHTRGPGLPAWSILLDSKYRRGATLQAALDEALVYKESVRLADGRRRFTAAYVVAPRAAGEAISTMLWRGGRSDEGLDEVGVLFLDPLDRDIFSREFLAILSRCFQSG